MLPLAFLMGFLGSMHCAVMCGPIMLSLPQDNKSYWNQAFQLFSYQIGRVITYTILGVIIGFIGNNLQFIANQKLVSICIGIVLIIFAFIQWFGLYSKNINSIQSKILAPVSFLMGKVFQKPLWGLMAGILNGLIPCGMVYLALATALNIGEIKSSAEFMFLFGLGTIPLMLLISLGGIYLKKYIHFNTNKLIPWFMFFLGTLFILRSSNLNIPFIAPNTGVGQHGQVIECK